MPPFPSVKLSEIMEGFDVQGNSFKDEKENGQCLIIAAGDPIRRPLYSPQRHRAKTPTI